jgi:outer membrane protein OmpA-like peptidoglycan-associated protein
MKKFVFLIIVLLFSYQQMILSQGIRERLFSGTDRIYQKAKNANAEILAPTFFEDGVNFYQKAEKGLSEGDNYDDIQNELSQANFYLSKAYETAVRSKELLKTALTARADAKNFKASEHADELWEEAEETLIEAAVNVEDEDPRDAEELGFEAEKLYRKAELKAIKHIYLADARNAIILAEENDAEDYAPITFELSKELVRRAEKELDSSRYENDIAKGLANQALMQADHSIAITDYLKNSDENDMSREAIILDHEKPLIEIAGELGIRTNLNNGFMGLSSKVQEEITRINQLKEDYKNLKAKLQQYEEELEKYAEEKSSLREKLDAIEKFEQKFNEIEGLFSSNEADVFREDKKIVIRLISLQFASGSAEIRPEFFDLLTRVRNSIEKFESPSAVVEGHTDSEGEAMMNLRLSQKRANAVYRYLTANLDIPKENVTAKGQGESKPIANNQTEAGRRKNRRIDIVITP